MAFSQEYLDSKARQDKARPLYLAEYKRLRHAGVSEVEAATRAQAMFPDAAPAKAVDGPHWTERQAASTKLVARARVLAMERRIPIQAAMDVAAAEDPVSAALATGQDPPAVAPVAGTITPKAGGITARRLREISAELDKPGTSAATVKALKREMDAAGVPALPARKERVPAPVSALPEGWTFNRSEHSYGTFWSVTSPDGDKRSPGYESKGLAVAWALEHDDDDAGPQAA